MAKKVEKAAKPVKGGLTTDRAKKIQDILAPIRKQFGEEAVMYGDQEVKALDVISTGSLRLNKALGVGGIPRGRIIEIYGPESSGKTTITLHLVAEAQKKGLLCAFIDAEHAMDAKYAEKLGCNTKEWIFAQPDNGEQGLEIADALVKSGEVGLIIIDSVAALTPKAEIEGDMGDSHMGLQARLMSQALRKLTGGISKTGCTVVFINQIRMKIGVMFGSPETTTGGNALKFYASIRLNIRAGEKIKKKDANGDEQVVGGEMVVKVVKNKCAPPFTEAKVPVMYGEGFNLGAEVYMRSVEKEFLEKSGGTHYFGGTKVAGSKEEALNKLNPKHATFDKAMFDELYRQVLDSYSTDEELEDEPGIIPEE